MVKLTQSFAQYLWQFHREKLSLILFGHMELITEDMYKDYLAWCQTDDGKQYLKGGSKYKPEEDEE